MKRILLIDDDDFFRRRLAEVLRQAGYEIEAAPDGEVALKLYRRQPVDLVITDLIMPEKEGLETIMELRRLDAKLKIIAVSGGTRIDGSEFLPAAKLLGADATLAKPFSAQQIRDAIAKLLEEEVAH
jgi:CheY-like chemotaxis protein